MGLAVAGVRTCFHLPAVLTTLANRASPSEVPAAPPAVTSNARIEEHNQWRRPGAAAGRPTRQSAATFRITPAFGRRESCLRGDERH